MRKIHVLTALASLLVAAPLLHADPIQWTVASGGNGDFFERVDTTAITYDAALAAAAAMSFDGLTGHLATLDVPNYTTERDFLFNSVYSPGVTSGRIYWVGATTPNNSSPWTWLDGVTVPSAIVSTWDIDFAEGNVREGAGFFETNSDTLWDYAATNPSNLSIGYIVEFAATPEPASLTLLSPPPRCS